MRTINNVPGKETPLRVFCYVRVSTDEQAQGASLEQQRRVIHEFCNRRELTVLSDVEDIETAATRGRSGFTVMLNRLRKGQADGIVFHKVDRSSRNFNDWVTLTNLMDEGFYIGFAAEGLESSDSSGRFTMDILAATAVHYIRNLKAEIRKGILGRIHQGLWPRNAPFGYLNPPPGAPVHERGKKQIDPQTAPLIRKVFKTYAEGEYTLKEMKQLAFDIGLRQPSGKARGISSIARMLDNPFYAGILVYDQQEYPGAHIPLISPELFAQVRSVRSRCHGGKGPRQTVRYLYQRLLTCAHCGYRLVAETKKGHIYYRCHYSEVGTTCVREESVTAAVTADLENHRFGPDQTILEELRVNRNQGPDDERRLKQRLQLEVNTNRSRLKQLTLSFAAGLVTLDTYRELSNDLEVQLSQAVTRLHEATTSTSTGPRPHSLLTYFATAPQRDQRVLLRKLYTSITVKGRIVGTEPA